MGVTPARRLRDLEKTESLREEGRKANESKFTEFKLGCEGGNITACNALGEWYALMRQDFEKAMEYYTPRCFKHRQPQACLNYGLVKATGRGGIAKSTTEAIDAFTIGCEEYNADSCTEGGRLLVSHALKSESSADAVGKSPREAFAEAARLFRTGCEHSSGGPAAKCCGMLGALYLGTKEVAPARPDEPLELLRSACEGEHVQSCFKLAKMYRHALNGFVKDEKLAEYYEQKGFSWAGISEQQATKLARKIPPIT